MEWVFSQIRLWLAKPTTFVPPLPWHNLQEGHLSIRGFVVGLVFLFLFATLPIPKMLHCRVKALCRHQLNFAMFTELCWHLL